MSLDFDALGARFRLQLSAADVVEHPFPHIILDTLFSGVDLRALYAGLPAEDTFDDHGGGLKSFQIWHGAVQRCNASATVKSFMNELDTHVFTQEIAEAVFRKFQPSLRDTYNVLFGTQAETQLRRIEIEPWTQAGAVNILAQKSVLPMHLDWPNRLVSLVLYLAPEDRWHREWGTQAYWVDRNSTPDPVSIFARTASPDGVALADASPFQICFEPGRVVAFLNTPWSYHGVHVVPMNKQASRWCVVKGVNMTLAATEHLFGLPPELRP